MISGGATVAQLIPEDPSLQLDLAVPRESFPVSVAVTRLLGSSLDYDEPIWEFRG